MNSVAPQDRDLAMVFQRDALYPHMTVFENLAFGLQLRKIPQAEIQTRVRETAALLGLSALLDRFPRALSGGERQRVALGRALAAKPNVLLLDEPLSALDEDTRDEIAALLKQAQRSSGVTALHITHSRREAAQLADVVFQLEDGRVTERPR